MIMFPRLLKTIRFCSLQRNVSIWKSVAIVCISCTYLLRSRAVQWSPANDGARSLTEILFRFFFEIEVSPMITYNLRLTTTL